MRIEVIGGGSLGLLFAAGAASAGTPTVLYTRTGEQAAIIAREGIEVRSPGEAGTGRRIRRNLHARPIEAFGVSGAEGRPTDDDGDRWIVLTVKQKDVDDVLIATLARGIRPGDRLLCLQNGIGHIERLAAALPQADVYAAITTEGARRLGPDVALHAGQGSTSFGLPQGGESSTPGRIGAEKKLTDTFAAAGLPLSASNDIQTAIYRKLLMNAVINPLTALWRVENGALLESGDRLAAMKALFDETVAVYASAGVVVPPEWWDDLLGVCRTTSRNRSSMLEDVSHGRETEAKWISGGIAALARRCGTAAPLNEMLLRLIEGMRPDKR